MVSAGPVLTYGNKRIKLCVLVGFQCCEDQYIEGKCYDDHPDYSEYVPGGIEYVYGDGSVIKLSYKPTDGE